MQTEPWRSPEVLPEPTAMTIKGTAPQRPQRPWDVYLPTSVTHEKSNRSSANPTLRKCWKIIGKIRSSPLLLVLLLNTQHCFFLVFAKSTIKLVNVEFEVAAASQCAQIFIVAAVPALPASQVSTTQARPVYDTETLGTWHQHIWSQVPDSCGAQQRTAIKESCEPAACRGRWPCFSNKL